MVRISDIARHAVASPSTVSRALTGERSIPGPSIPGPSIPGPSIPGPSIPDWSIPRQWPGGGVVARNEHVIEPTWHPGPRRSARPVRTIYVP